MYHCYLHQWSSFESGCPHCQTTQSSNAIVVNEMEPKPKSVFESLDRETIDKILDDSYCSNCEELSKERDEVVSLAKDLAKALECYSANQINCDGNTPLSECKREPNIAKQALLRHRDLLARLQGE